jgi:hypothetical protein
MADEADVANDHHERWLQGQLEEHQHQLNQVGHHRSVKYVECVFCQSSTENGDKYCSPECRDDDERLIAAKIRNGL